MIVDIEFDKAASVRAALAIEFAHNKIRIMQIERGGDSYRLRSLSEVSLNPLDVEKGIIKDPILIGAKLAEAVRIAQPKSPSTQYVICIIPQKETFLTVIELPAIDKAELRDLLERKARDIIPMDESKVYWDWHRIQTQGNKTSIQLAAVSQEIIDSYMLTLENARLIPLLFEPSTTAASRVAFPADSKQLHVKSPEVVILLEIGAEYGVLALLQKGGIVFSTDISLKSDSKAERIVVLEQKITELVTYAKSHLNLANEAALNKVVVYGDSVSVFELLPLLKERSSLSLDLINIKYIGSDLENLVKERNEYSYIPLIGAAIRGLPNYNEESTLNLIPRKAKAAFQKKELYNVLRNYLMFIAVNTAFLVFMLLIVAMQIRDKVSDLQSNYNDILAISNSPIVNEIEAKVAGLNSKTNELNSLVSSLYDWQVVLDVLNKNTPDQITLTNVSTEFYKNPQTGVLDSWTVNISGRSRDRESIIRYVEQLRTTGLFNEVELPVGSLELESNTAFVIEAKLPFIKLLEE